MYYSSCVWSGTQFRDFIKNNLISTFARDNISSKVILGEDGNWDETRVLDTLNDTTACGRVDIVAEHAYNGGTAPLTVSLSKNKKVWMTEAGNMGYNDNTINDQLWWAKMINDHMLSNVSGWFYW
jgi:glucuronoarabinoxylan endo-1,4-beta-xylanase